jgi:hypothetical protein
MTRWEYTAERDDEELPVPFGQVLAQDRELRSAEAT